MHTLPPPGHSGAPPQPEEPTTRERVARIKTLARRSASHWKMAFLLFVLGCGIAVGAAWNQKRSYRSECIVQFKARMKAAHEEESASERALKLAPKLKEQLNTRARLEAVIKEFHLYPKIVDSQGMLAAVEEMREKHVGFRGKDSESYVISFEDESPELAQKVTQKLADTMIEEYTRGNLDQIVKQVRFLTAEEQRSELELVNANRGFATFLSKNPEFAAEAKNGAGGGLAGAKAPNIVMPNKITSGDPVINALERQRQRIADEIKSIETGKPLAPAAIVGTPAQEARVAKAKRDREEAQKSLDEANARVSSVRASGASDANPDMVSAKRQLDMAKNLMTASENAVREAEMDIRLRANPFDAPAAGANIEDLKKKLAQVDGQIAAKRAGKHPVAEIKPGIDAAAVAVAAEPVSEIVLLESEFSKLSRSLTEKKVEHDEIREQLKKAELDEARIKVQGGDTMAILDPAYRPMKPSKGGKSKTAMTGGAVALFVALLYAFARVIFNDTMIDAADIESLKLIPVLGVLPKIPMTPVGAPANGNQAAIPKGGAPGGV